jgi:uncharacterized protein YaaN involved in tellurite resistance
MASDSEDRSRQPSGANQPAQTSLVPALRETVAQELALPDPLAIRSEAGADTALEEKADQFVTALVSRAASDRAVRNEGRQAVETMGLALQKQAAAQSEMLKQPLRKLSREAEDGGNVANSLVDLKIQVESLDPAKVDFQPGWATRMLGWLPGVGTPLKRYFSKYETAQTAIAAIIRSLEMGRDQLARDNVTLVEDQKRMGELTVKLEKAVRLGQLIDQKLQHRIEREVQPGSPEEQFIGEELLFPLRQRITDLQQQLAVNQQGIIATEVIVRNNSELVRGVNRALNVTVAALQVAVTVALALENQKIVLDKLEAVSKTTDDLIAGTASRLRSQGVEIQKRAGSAQLNMESLRAAFNDLRGALEDITQFRLQALPAMASTILELDRMSADAKQVIEKLETSRDQQAALTIDIE